MNWVSQNVSDIGGSVKGLVNNPLQSIEKGVGGTINAAFLGIPEGVGMTNTQLGGDSLAVMGALAGGSYLMGGLGGAGSAANPLTADLGDFGASGSLGAGGGGGGFLSAAGGAGGGAGSGGGSLLGTLGGLTSIGSGLYGMYESSQLANMAQNADPFGPYRAQYAQQLSQLEANPSLIQNTPGYSAGIQAVQRGMGAQGYGNSGNLETSLLKYGGDIYNQQVNTLADLGGANISPAVQAQIQQSAIQTASSSLGSLGYGAAMLGGWNPNYMYTGGH